jgi:two-component system, chemotaxis family, sensor kinase CheA
MTDTNNDLLSVFWEEVADYLGVLNESLLRVEMATGADKITILKEMNRVAHSMKGAARAVGYGLIETIAHYMEELFHLALDKGMPITPQVADTLYDGLDLIQNVMSNTENDTEVVTQVLLMLEKTVLDYQPTTVEIPMIVASLPTIPDKKATLEDIQVILPETNMLEGETVMPVVARTLDETIRVSIQKLDQLMAEVSELSLVKMRGDIRLTRMNNLRKHLAKWQRDWRNVRTAYIRLIRRLQEDKQAIPPEVLTLTKFLETNQRYLTDANRMTNQAQQMLVTDQLNLSTLTEQLQERVSGLRMMPFETVAGSFQRMVRDLARDLKKQVVLDILGVHVEIDKVVLDALKEPLMHLLRNSLDHGIETPQEREERSKPVFGVVELSVEQRGSEILIQVSDDGRGLDVARIRQKALAKGLIKPSDAENMSDEDARMLVFQSGFSTADSVTAISGRGLGMDIVRERVEGLRGRISLTSVEGKGTRTSINVPVSLTRIRCIMLRVGQEEYAIPSVMISRMERIQRTELYTAKGQYVLNLNGRTMPFLHLADTLGTPITHQERPEIDVIVLQALDKLVAFEVDDLYSELELVLKPLGRELANTSFVAGASLLGSGEVVIVLDANDLVRVASGDNLPKHSRQISSATISNERRLRVLVVDDSITTRTLEKNILEAVGFEVFVAVDGLEAWTQVTDIMPDVIVSDVEMPHMNGLELTRRLKSDARTRDIPLILLTSLGKPEQREAGLQAGADAYLIKSRFDQNELLATIRSVL